MATRDNDPAVNMEAFLQDLNSQPADRFEEWSDVEDLARMAMESHQRRTFGARAAIRSSGSIRVVGDGVVGHSMHASTAGVLLQSWQRLVSSVGAAIDGTKTARGNLPQSVLSRTALRLAASPQPGSIIFDFEPDSEQDDERYPDDHFPMFGETETLVDQSVEKVMEVLATAADHSDVDGSKAVELLTELGPRVASDILALTEIAERAHLDLDMQWSEPNRARRKVYLGHQASQRFGSVLRSHRLNTEIEDVHGILRTISDLRKIEVEVEHVDPTTGEVSHSMVKIKKADVDFSGFTLRTEITVRTERATTMSPGGKKKIEFTALQVL